MIESCVKCPQYVVKEIEPELPAFCLYWGEGLLIDNPICRLLKEGRVPKERVSSLSDLATASPYGLPGLGYVQSLKTEEPRQDAGDPSPEEPPGGGGTW